METYRVTIINDISGKKRRVNIQSFSLEKAIEKASWEVHRTSERIIKAELKP